MARAASRITWIACLVLPCLLACGDARPDAPVQEQADAKLPPPASPPRDAQYVGAETCAGCHAEETSRWRGSHHDRAMEEARPETVLGDFSGGSLEHFGQRFRFERRDDRYWIRTADAQGQTRDFSVAYTFGVWPLQQYLVDLPGGRLQAVAAAWDTRPAAVGGQRWLHLPEDEPVPPGDVLHWTGLAGSWNAMCAECHSTNLRKGYIPEQDTYAPEWSALDVSCEACHGPASRHLEWAESAQAGQAKTDEASRGLMVPLAGPHEWRFVPGRPVARRFPAEPSRQEIETCAPCHSRRSRIAESAPGMPFMDGHMPALIEPGLYFPDGQIRDEVYVWGSFVQSRMYAAGVTCSDCHDPHALRIEQPDETCARCHAPATFATPEHHHHPADSAGASCVACHMPTRTYMAVDDRRDHGFRIPRPDLAVTLDVPDACTGCHTDREPAWAAAALTRWSPEAVAETSSRRHFAEAFEAARRGEPDAAAELAAIATDASRPAMVRASAVHRLESVQAPIPLPALFEALEDPDPLVRAAAARASRSLPPPDQVVGLSPLLRDPVRAVRIEAARTLAPQAQRVGSADARRAHAAALEEYREAQRLNADRPEARVNLGVLAGELGDLDAARRHYEAALRVGPFFVPAYVNLADVHRREGREDEAERVLRLAIERVPDAAPAHHALGLLLVRERREEEALEELARAVEIDPQTSRFAYVYGIALHSSGNEAAAARVLETSLRHHPYDVQLLVALATLHRDAGRWDAALHHARRLRELRPDDPDARALLAQIERAAASGGGHGGG